MKARRAAFPRPCGIRSKLRLGGEELAVAVLLGAFHRPSRSRRGAGARAPDSSPRPWYMQRSSRVPWRLLKSIESTYRLSVDQRPRDHGAIEADPPHAWQIDVLVALLYAVPEPQDRREQVGAPRGNRNTGGFVAQPDREDLRDGHEQGEHRHAPQQPAQSRFLLSRGSGRRGWIYGHRRLLRRTPIGAFDNTLAPVSQEESAMRQFTEDTLTNAVLARLKDAKHPRFKQIITGAVKHLHAFARDVQLTEEEWFEGIKFLSAVGQKCDGKRQEFILLSDILGLSMMVVALNHKTPPGATEATVLGPFFVHGAPEFEYGADFTKGATVEGETTWVTGRVLSIDGKPIPSAALDIWQARANGVYDIQDPDAEFELRGRVLTNAEGRYAFKTYKPQFYGVPDDGPVGDLLRAMGRHPMRPAHMHAIVSADGYQQVITHVFVAGDPYLDSDAVFAVKESLIVNFRKVDSPAEAKKLDLSAPFLRLDWDFHLAPAGAGQTRRTVAASDAVT